MRILLVAATPMEVAPITKTLGLTPELGVLSVGRAHGHDVEVLVTGVGMVATAARVSRALTAQTYDLALDLGVCGSFDPAHPPGSVVHVTVDQIPELGAEDGEAFLPASHMGLVPPNEPPHRDGVLVNTAPPSLSTLSALPAVRGITVNTAHGDDASIARVRALCAPQVESMEGAAFLYAALIADVPCAQVRAVSNMVERRNRAAWQLGPAIDALGRTTLALLDDLR